MFRLLALLVEVLMSLPPPTPPSAFEFEVERFEKVSLFSGEYFPLLRPKVTSVLFSTRGENLPLCAFCCFRLGMFGRTSDRGKR